MSNSTEAMAVERLDIPQLGELSQEQLATILMGLRLVQRMRGQSLYKELEDYFETICTDPVIDDLCDRLNWGTPVVRGTDGGSHDFRKKVLSAVAPLRIGTQMFLDIFDQSGVEKKDCEHYELLRKSVAAWKQYEVSGNSIFPSLGGNQQ